MKKNVIKIFALIFSMCIFFSGCDVLNVYVHAHNLKLIRNSEAYTIRETIDSSVTEITIPYAHDDGLVINTMGDGAFSDCESLIKVNYLGALDDWVQINFADFDANPIYYTKNIYLDDQLLEHGVINLASKVNAYALANCDSLLSIEFGDNVTEIGKSAFFSCDKLKNVVISKNVSAIGSSAFSQSVALESVTFEQNGLLKEISIGMFYGCKQLKSIDIPNNINKIRESAFYACSSLNSVNIASSVTSISNYAFKHCTKLSQISFDGTIEDWQKVQKGEDWNYGIVATKVKCADGMTDI